MPTLTVPHRLRDIRAFVHVLDGGLMDTAGLHAASYAHVLSQLTDTALPAGWHGALGHLGETDVWAALCDLTAITAGIHGLAAQRQTYYLTKVDTRPSWFAAALLRLDAQHHLVIDGSDSVKFAVAPAGGLGGQFATVVTHGRDPIQSRPRTDIVAGLVADDPDGTCVVDTHAAVLDAAAAVGAAALVAVDNRAGGVGHPHRWSVTHASHGIWVDA